MAVPLNTPAARRRAPPVGPRPMPGRRAQRLSSGRAAMTFEDELEVRRASVGAKVLGFAFAILAVLGSFWTVVWFIRSYVEQPRVNLAPTVSIASQEAVVPPAPTIPPAPIGTAEIQPAVPDLPPAPLMADTPPPPPLTAPIRSEAPAPSTPDPRSTTGSLSDRWSAIGPGTASDPAPAPAPRMAALPPPPPVIAAPPVARMTPAPSPAAAAPEPASDDQQIEEVEETSVPAIAGPAPLPRRKPTHVAASASRQPPLPRARPDSPAPQSIWTPVTPTDDRYQATQ